MAVYCCETHKIKLTITEDRRSFDTPPGSWAGMPQCRLMLMVTPQEGTFGQCVIKKVG
jgi:hypothetical protein